MDSKSQVLFFKKMVLAIFTLVAIGSVSAIAQKPIERKGGSYVKTSLNAFSFSKMLNYYNKTQLKDSGMSMIDMLDYCAEHNFDGVDLTGYFFPGYPAVPSDEFINSIKKRAFQLGLDISGTGVRNDLASIDPAKRAADVKHIKEWIDVAVKLGAPVVRIFSGPVPKGYENKWDSIANYMAAAMKECADYGKLRGVLVGVQNHGDFLKTADDCIKLIKLVNSEWFGLIVDTGYFISKDPYLDIEKVMPYAVNFQVKESPFGVLSRVHIDMKRLMKIVHKSGYRGYLPIETLGDKVMKGQPMPETPFRPYEPFKQVPALLKELKDAIREEYKTQVL
jgi:sugar phosphate isomerase/epimerase